MVDQLHSQVGALEVAYSEALKQATDAAAGHVAASAVFSESLAQAVAAVGPDQPSASFGDPTPEGQRQLEHLQRQQYLAPAMGPYSQLSPLRNRHRAQDGSSWRHTPAWGAPGQPAPQQRVWSGGDRAAFGLGMNKHGVVDHHWLRDHTSGNMPIALWSQVHPRAAYAYAMWAWQHCCNWLVL